MLRAVTQHELPREPLASLPFQSTGTRTFAAVFLLWHGRGQGRLGIGSVAKEMVGLPADSRSIQLISRLPGLSLFAHAFGMAPGAFHA